MKRSPTWRILALATLLVAQPAAAQSEAAPTKPAAPPAETAVPPAAAAAAAEDTREALAMLKEASDYLAALPKYAFEAEFAYDAVQATGQKLEFGGTRQILVRRPDRVRSIARTRTGDQATLYFDGKSISVSLPDDAAYVSVEKPGTLNEIVDYIENELDTPLPFSDLITAHFYEEISEPIDYGIYVGDETVLEIPCTHLAFKSQGIDFQVWIEAGNRPLIRRIVIDYKGEHHHPQFRAQILKWNLAPDVRDALFAFRPAPGAERLSVAAATDLRRQRRGDEAEVKP